MTYHYEIKEWKRMIRDNFLFSIQMFIKKVTHALLLITIARLPFSCFLTTGMKMVNQFATLKYFEGSYE